MATTRKTTRTSTRGKTTTRKTTTTRGKTAAAKKTAAKSTSTATKTATKAPAPVKLVASAETPAKTATATSADVTVVSSNPVVAGPTVKKQDFLTRVLESCDVKKRDAKPVMEAVLAELGKALSAGEDLQLPPLGKLMVQRQKDIGSGEVLTLRLRRTGASASKGKTGT